MLFEYHWYGFWWKMTEFWTSTSSKDYLIFGTQCSWSPKTSISTMLRFFTIFKCGFCQKSKFTLSKLINIAIFGLLKLPNLISRKIWNWKFSFFTPCSYVVGRLCGRSLRAVPFVSSFQNGNISNFIWISIEMSLSLPSSFLWRYERRKGLLSKSVLPDHSVEISKFFVKLSK